MNKISKKFEENMHFKKFSNKPKTELKNKIYNNKNNKYNINNLDNIYAFNNNKIKTKKSTSLPHYNNNNIPKNKNFSLPKNKKNLNNNTFLNENEENNHFNNEYLNVPFFNIKNKPIDYKNFNKNNCTEYKINNEYEENNKIKDFHEIIIRFKLNSEEYKLLLKEKAKLINPFN